VQQQVGQLPQALRSQQHAIDLLEGLLPKKSMYEKALPLRERLCRASPGNLLYRGNLGGTQWRLGAALERLGRQEEALTA
jgi:hypothetical protein